MRKGYGLVLGAVLACVAAMPLAAQEATDTVPATTIVASSTSPTGTDVSASGSNLPSSGSGSGSMASSSALSSGPAQWDLDFGYRFGHQSNGALHTSSPFGLGVSVGIRMGSIFRLVGGYGYAHGTSGEAGVESVAGNTNTFIAGVQTRHYIRGDEEASPFIYLQGLIGGAHESLDTTTISGTAFAFFFSGGYSVPLKMQFGKHPVGFYGQVDLGHVSGVDNGPGGFAFGFDLGLRMDFVK